MKFYTLLLLWLVSTLTYSKQLALSFDDGVDPNINPDAQQINTQILQQLNLAKIQAIVFPSVIKIGDYQGLQLIADWGKQGHQIGNHSELHLNLNKESVAVEQYIQGIGRAEYVFRPLGGWVARYRFPFLKEGDTLQKREQVRAYLKQQGYLSGAVSIDASDWFYNQKFILYTKNQQVGQLQRLKQAYIAHLLGRANYYDELAHQTVGYSPKHVLLLHVNKINAAYLGDVIQAFAQQGWQWIDVKQAYQDPLYQQVPQILPAGESVIWSLAKLKGVPNLRYPAEDAPYEQENLKHFGLLP